MSRETLPLQRSRSEEAYQVLRQQLLEGKFEPRYRLTEVRLAAQLGMSRIPIREALNRLEAEGLLRSVPYRGYMVPDPSPEEMRDMLDIRLSIDVFISQAATERVNVSIFEQLEAICVRADQAMLRSDSQEFARQMSG